MTAAQVSKATGIPKSSLSEWLALRVPKIDPSLCRLAKYFDVSLEFLITGESESTEERLIKEIAGSLEDGFVSIHKGIYRINIEKQTKSSHKKGDGE